MGLLDTLREALGLRAESDAARAADPDDLFGMSTAHVTMEADLDFRSAGVAALCFGEVDSTDFAATVDDVEEILRAGEEETGTAFSRQSDDHGYHWVVLEDSDPEDLVTSVHFAADTFVERGYGSRLLAAVFAFVRERGASGARPERSDGLDDASGERSDPRDASTSGDRAGSERETRAERASRKGERRRREPPTREEDGAADGSRRNDREERAGGLDAERVYWIYSFRRGAYYPFVPSGDHERDQRTEFKLQSVLSGELAVEDDESYWYPLWPDSPDGHPWE